MMWAISIIRKQLKALKHGTNQDADGDGDQLFAVLNTHNISKGIETSLNTQSQLKLFYNMQTSTIRAKKKCLQEKLPSEIINRKECRRRESARLATYPVGRWSWKCKADIMGLMGQDCGNCRLRTRPKTSISLTFSSLNCFSRVFLNT